ncbi:MAG: RdgB/HAM1 family non-canonical purine NTP pyrophosphatase [Myxococcota bacterium]
MSRFTRLVIASGNSGKFRELRSLLADLNVELVPRSKWNLPSPAETGLTFVENAILKARHAAACTGLPALADDSGLIVDALNGAPGVRSARFAGSHATCADNIRKLLRLLKGVCTQDRKASLHCTLAVCRHANDPNPLLAYGRWEGSILQDPQGEGGFGYDKVFYVKTHGCSAAQLDPAQKNRLSHRAVAFKQLHAQLSYMLGSSALTNAFSMDYSCNSL